MNKSVPDIFCPVFEPDDIRRVGIRPVEKEQKDLARVLRIEGEIDPIGEQRCAEGIK
jgi:hypothetical protein